MDDVKIINKEKDDKMTALLKDELHKDRMDPFKITTLYRDERRWFCETKKQYVNAAYCSRTSVLCRNKQCFIDGQRVEFYGYLGCVRIMK